MRSYKSIEKPAQVLGMNIMDLGLVVGLFIGSVLLLGFLNMMVPIPRLVYLAVFLLEVGLILVMRFLTKTHPPGFLIGWLSFHFVQPRRIAVGLVPPVKRKDEKAKIGSIQ
ncbi:hypothetical protein ACFSC6_07990 [Rufibacter sediminis]|uniref:Conjugal transfer protein TraF n=2 Tax=Rufibacter sediminis TaxID=2762756 RepID=A0ABR6VM97_9BACT|nr:MULTISPECIES: hypothetical protein [Rufibacter]MBC3538271.1 hypothetical protein [Rufibacter sediminis]